MRVRDLMSGDVVTIEETASCHAAVEQMVRHRIRHLPVVTDGGALCGVVTDRDLRHHLFTPEVFSQVGVVPVGRLLDGVRVRDVMSAPPITAGPDDRLEDAARAMLEDKVGSLPVVDGRRVVGIITETDLLRRIVGADACCGEVEEIIISFP